MDMYNVEDSLEIEMTQEHRDAIEATLKNPASEVNHPYQLPEQDPFSDGTVVMFKKKFRGTPREYTYVAVRAVGYWYYTSPNAPNGASWEVFVSFLNGTDIYVFEPPKGPYRGH